MGSQGCRNPGFHVGRNSSNSERVGQRFQRSDRALLCIPRVETTLGSRFRNSSNSERVGERFRRCNDLVVMGSQGCRNPGFTCPATVETLKELANAFSVTTSRWSWVPRVVCNPYFSRWPQQFKL